MRRCITASTAVFLAVLTTAPASADTGSPGFVDHTEWVRYPDGSSLRVYPTQFGRIAARLDAAQFDADASGEDAWREVLASAPDAASPGMREQFLCHWKYAELARPGKTSWNLEPWRPVVDDVTMVESGCNPGAADEGF